MSTHPFIPLYVDDYDAATAHLTPEEDGIYSRLIRLSWRTPGCSLPNDHAWIARKIRLNADDFVRIALPVLDEFFALQRGRLVQRRLKREYDDITRKKTARKQAGKKGGDAKALKNKLKDDGNASDLPAHTRASPEPEPKPEPERLGYDVDSRDERVAMWSVRLAEAHVAGADGLDLSAPNMHVFRDLRMLCEPLSGEPCTWDEVLDAIRICAARAKSRGRPMRSWTWVRDDAIALRDRRLNSHLPDPKAPHDDAPHDDKPSRTTANHSRALAGATAAAGQRWKP